MAVCDRNAYVSLYYASEQVRSLMHPHLVLGPMVTLEDCLAAFFAADELKGKE